MASILLFQGSKGIKVNGNQTPDWQHVAEVFQDANHVVKSNFGSPNFQAVVVVPNSTSTTNRDAIARAARAAGFEVVQVINENTAVAAAYADKENDSAINRRLAIVSVTGGILDVSIITILSDLEFQIVAEETHPAPIEFEESKNSGPVGLFGIASVVIGGVVKALVEDPLDKFFDVIKTLMASPKLGDLPVDEIVLVGKASKSEKLKHAAKERFASAGIWLVEELGEDEYAARGAAVIAHMGKQAITDDQTRQIHSAGDDHKLNVEGEYRIMSFKNLGTFSLGG